MTPLRLFGSPSPRHKKAAETAAFHSQNLYKALMDSAAMWDPVTLDVIAGDFPAHLLPLNDIYLVLAECVANAAEHARADALAFFVRQRGKVFLLSFAQTPPMGESVIRNLEQARTGILPDYALDVPGGLGFPILIRVARRVTISLDRTRLQLWFRL